MILSWYKTVLTVLRLMELLHVSSCQKRRLWPWDTNPKPICETFCMWPRILRISFFWGEFNKKLLCTTSVCPVKAIKISFVHRYALPFSLFYAALHNFKGTVEYSLSQHLGTPQKSVDFKQDRLSIFRKHV